MVPQPHAPEPDPVHDDSDVAAVRELVSYRFGLPDAGVARFDQDHLIFKITNGSQVRVLRVGQDLDRYAAVLSVLERVGYRGPRVVPALSDGPVVELTYRGEPHEALMITFVDGSATPFEPAALQELGAALGRLHRVGSAAVAAAGHPITGLPVIERAQMLPANELRFALSCLRPVEELVVAEDRTEWERLVGACERGLDFGSGLTQVFLHGDAHPWNSVHGPSGQVSLIDWDSSGPGPAVIDFAFLAVSCDTGGLIWPLAPPDPARLEAVVAGYAGEMTLSDADLAALEEAIAFRVLVAARVGFASVVRQHRRPRTEPGIVWSLDRLELVPSIAERIRQSARVMS